MKLHQIITTLKKPVFVLVLAAVLMVSTINLVLVSYVYHQSQLSSNQLQSFNNQHLANLITSSINNLNRPLPIDAISGKAYISNAMLSLPATPISLDLILYSYTPAGQGIPAELHLVSNDDLQKAEQPLRDTSRGINAVFTAVPRLQACARGITIDFASQTGRSATFQKSLTDGRTAYFYTEATCFNKDLLQYAQQLNSY